MTQWNFTGTSAEWADNSVSLAWDPAEPDKGLNVRIPDCVTQSTFNLFGISLLSGAIAAPPSPNQLTSSGTALRATFPKSERFPVETQITWSLLNVDKAVLGLNVVVSIDTQELEAHPEIVLSSRITDAVAFESGSSGATGAERHSYTLCRPHNSDLTYVEMIHPDAPHSRRASKDDEDGGVLLRHTLFACPLEKGVILRARLRGLLLRREGDEAAAAACFAQFCDVPPPLGR